RPELAPDVECAVPIGADRGRMVHGSACTCCHFATRKGFTRHVFDSMSPRSRRGKLPSAQLSPAFMERSRLRVICATPFEDNLRLGLPRYSFFACAYRFNCDGVTEVASDLQPVRRALPRGRSGRD